MHDAPTILSALWRASWQAGVLCLLVLALRWTLRDRLPAAWRCRLWGLVFLRLLLPAVPASPLSLFNVVPPDPLPAAVWPIVTVVVHGNAPVPPPPAADEVAPVVAPTSPRPVWPTLLLTTWASGATSLAVLTIVSHVRFARRVRAGRSNVPAELTAMWREAGGRRPLVVTDAVGSPALFGLIRGRLLLPPDLPDRLSPDEVRLVFRHELAHVHRWDLAASWVAVAVRCVYWFHPLVWLAERLRRADAEAACDDAVVADTRDPVAYGRTLLAVAGGGRVPAVGMADGRTDLKRRLANVARNRRPGWRSTAVAAGLTAAIGCMALTGARPADNVTRTYQPFLAASYSATQAPFADRPPLASGRPQTLAELADLVRRTVTPDVWRQHGTGVAVDGHALRVTAPPDTQAGVARLLTDLDTQVSVETRVLSVLPDVARAAGVDVPAAGVIHTVPDDQAERLMAAVAADSDSTQLTAPRLTLFSGQVAQLVIDTQQAYVSDMRPVFEAGGVTRLDPTVSTTHVVGVYETVRATVAADRRTVDLTARLELNRLRELERVELAYTRGGQTVRGALQLPHTHTTRAEPTVRLTSGQTVLLRGTESDTDDPAGPTTRPSTGPAAKPHVVLVLIRATVLPPRAEQPQRQFPLLPAPATRPTAAAPTARAAGRAAAKTMSLRPAIAPGPYPVTVANLVPARPTPAPPPPGTLTPDGRGVTMAMPLDVRHSTVLVDGRSPAADVARRLVVGQGGRLADRITADTDYVVADVKPTDPGVREDAKALHIPVMTPAQFRQKATPLR